MGADVRLRAMTLARQHVAATVALVVFGGIAAGLALGLWGMARRGSSAFERFKAYEDRGDLTLYACAEGVAPAPDNAVACAGFDYADVLPFVQSLPQVAAAGRYTTAIATMAPAARPQAWERQLVTAAIDPTAGVAIGRARVLDGRLADPARPEEVVVNEGVRDRFGLGVGDTAVLTPYTRAEYDAAGEGKVRAGGAPTTVRVVGVVRYPDDLAEVVAGAGIYQNGGMVYAGSAWWQQARGDVATYGTGIGVKLVPGASPADIESAFHARWPDRVVHLDASGVGFRGGTADVGDAISLQARGIELVAAVVALAGVVFVGQAMARQVRREWADARVLTAMGMSRGAMVRAALVRGLFVALPAALVAGPVCVALSPLGPIGIARAAEVRTGLRADPLVLAVGLPLVVLVLLTAAAVPAATVSRPTRVAVATRRGRWASVGSPTIVAGSAMGASQRSGDLALWSAVGGVALAATAAVAAWSISSSYDRLLEQPAGYGASWDAVVGNVGSAAQEEATQAALRDIPGIRVAGLDNVSGADGLLLTTFKPLLGPTPVPVVAKGRPPIGGNEVALGRATMRELHASIGSTVRLPPGDAGGVPVTVVGQAIMNDGYGAAQPDHGIAAPAELYQQLAPDSRSAVYAVWIDADQDRAAVLARLRETFPTTFIGPVPPTSVRNVGLVERQPLLLALIVGLFAAAALVHALVLCVSRSRRQIAVLKTLGFTRSQVTRSVAWYASTLAGLALLIGIPAGVIVGRHVWTTVSANLGVSAVPVVPMLTVLGVGLVVLAVANVAALVPGWSAARTRPASTLHAE